MYYIENLLPSEGSTVYKCGSLVDLCLGPHIQNTGKIKAFQIMKVGEHGREWHISLTNVLSRIPHATFEEIKTTIRCSGYTALLSRKRSKWQLTKNFSKRHLSEITVRSVPSKNCSSLMMSLPAMLFFFRMGLSSSTLSRNYCAPNTKSADTRKCKLLICTTLTYGKDLATGSIIETICSASKSRKKSGLWSQWIVRGTASYSVIENGVTVSCR